MTKIHLETIGSTNSYLKERHRRMVDFSLVWADRQTEGRGRLGRTWEDGGKSALFSILLKDRLKDLKLSEIPLVAAEAVHRVLSPLIPELSIKWPNDLWVKGKKLAGILCEGVFEGDDPLALVVGIGINVNQDSFPPDMRTIPTSLLLETGETRNVEPLVDDIAEAFRQALGRYCAGDRGFLDYGNRHSALSGQVVRFLWVGEERTGIAGRMGPDGSLEIETLEGIEIFRSGEITLLK